MNKKRWMAFLLPLLPSALLADTVYLKGGGKLSGRIVTRTDTRVQVDVGAGTIDVSMTNVDRIVEERSPLSEYAERAAALGPRDVEGWRDLGRWASSQGLNTQARQAYEKVLTLAPGDAEANQALGQVQVGGRWVSEEESYRARGYVKFEGEWMTPAEQQRITQASQDRSAAAEANRARRETPPPAREPRPRSRRPLKKRRKAFRSTGDGARGRLRGPVPIFRSDRRPCQPGIPGDPRRYALGRDDSGSGELLRRRARTDLQRAL